MPGFVECITNVMLIQALLRVVEYPTQSYWLPAATPCPVCLANWTPLMVTVSIAVPPSISVTTHGFFPSAAVTRIYFSCRLVPLVTKGRETRPTLSVWLTMYAPDGRANLKLYLTF